jgi:hypothetical protein
MLTYFANGGVNESAAARRAGLEHFSRQHAYATCYFTQHLHVLKAIFTRNMCLGWSIFQGSMRTQNMLLYQTCVFVNMCSQNVLLHATCARVQHVLLHTT